MYASPGKSCQVCCVAVAYIRVDASLAAASTTDNVCFVHAIAVPKHLPANSMALKVPV